MLGNHDLAALAERVHAAEREYKANVHSARVKLGMVWLEAQREFAILGVGTWRDWVAEHGDGRSASDVRKLIGIAKAVDPEAKAAEVREAAAESMAATREKRSNVGSHAQAAIEGAKADPVKPTWDRAPAMPSGTTAPDAAPSVDIEEQTEQVTPPAPSCGTMRVWPANLSPLEQAVKDAGDALFLSDQPYSAAERAEYRRECSRQLEIAADLICTAHRSKEEGKQAADERAILLKNVRSALEAEGSGAQKRLAEHR